MEKENTSQGVEQLREELRESGVDVGSIDSVEQLKWLMDHPDFERYPVCIEEFIDNPKYLGANKCRRSVKKKMIKIFGDQEYVDKNPKAILQYEETVDMEGIGGGKTFSASLFTLYILYRLLCLKSPQEYYGKSPLSGIYLMLMSTSEKNARDVIFTEINARILENKEGFFAKHYLPDPQITTQLNFEKNLKIIPGNSSETFFVGYNIFAAVIDECDDHKKTKEKDYVEEGYLAIRRRIISRFPGYGGLMMIGSPKDVNGFMMRKYRIARKDDNMLAIRMATWEALDPEEFRGPKFKAKDPQGKKHLIPVEYQKDWEKNPERFWRDLGAIPSFTVEPFFTLTQRVRDCVNPELTTWDGTGQMPAIRGSGRKEYIFHVDLGINNNGSDHCGIALGHIVGSKKVMEFGRGQMVERPHIVIDFIARLSALSDSEVQISEVRQLIVYLKDQGFLPYYVSFDGWQSKDSQQILNRMGINTKQVSLDRDMFGYEALKESIYDQRVEYGELFVSSEIEGMKDTKIDIVTQELLQLKRVKGKKVDHPVDGSKDVADAIAGVVLGLTGTSLLHKMGTRYRPRYVRDNFNIERDQNHYGNSGKRLSSGSSKTRSSTPKIAGSTGLW